MAVISAAAGKCVASVISAAATFSPILVGDFLVQRGRKPDRTKLSLAVELAWKEAGKMEMLGDIATYVLSPPGGTSGPPVLFVHGWEGNAGQFEALAAAVVAEGRQAILFDFYAHGLSAGPELQDWVQMRDVLRTIVSKYYGAGPIGCIVCHSGGAVVVREALRSGWLRVDQLVMLSPGWESAKDLMYDNLCNTCGLSREVYEAYTAAWARRFGDAFFTEWGGLGVPSSSAATRILSVHARNDKVCNCAMLTEKWASEGHPHFSALMLKRSGHNRVLSDDRVLYAVSEFMHGRQLPPIAGHVRMGPHVLPEQEPVRPVSHL